MSLLSSPYLLVSVSFSSKTGVSMALAPWRSNTLSITCAGDKQAQNSSTAGYKSWTINRPRENTQRRPGPCLLIEHA